MNNIHILIKKKEKKKKRTSTTCKLNEMLAHWKNIESPSHLSKD